VADVVAPLAVAYTLVAVPAGRPSTGGQLGVLAESTEDISRRGGSLGGTVERTTGLPDPSADI
jgi:hypothetical protein